MNDDARKNKQKDMTKNLKKPLIITSLLAFLFCVTVGNLSQTNNQLLDENSQLKKQVADLKIENETTTNNDNIEEYSSQIEELKASNKELSKKVKSLEEDAKKAQNQQSTIDKLNKKISDQKSKIGKLNDKISSLKEKVSTLNNQITKYKNSGNKSNKTSSSSENSYTVYITATGSKYHRNGCRYLSRSQISISKSDAISQGYDACSVCNP